MDVTSLLKSRVSPLLCNTIYLCEYFFSNTKLVRNNIISNRIQATVDLDFNYPGNM